MHLTEGVTNAAVSYGLSDTRNIIVAGLIVIDENV
jgi:hypothetical protein